MALVNGVDYTPRTFSELEMQILSPYFTNLAYLDATQNTRMPRVAAIKDWMPASVAGALLSRYSRSHESAPRLFLKEFAEKDKEGNFTEREIRRSHLLAEVDGMESLAERKANEFYQRVLAGYGDDSVNDMQFVRGISENVSQLVALTLTDGRLSAHIESSTRYLDWSKKVAGGYLYHTPVELLGTRFEQPYGETMDLAFEVFTKIRPPIIKLAKEKFPIESSGVTFDFGGQKTGFDGIEDPEDRELATKGYENAMKARTFDAVRSLLPLSSMTKLGTVADTRSWTDILNKMYASPLAEVRQRGKEMFAELSTVVPLGVESVEKPEKGGLQKEYVVDKRESLRRLAIEVLQGIEPEKDRDQVRLVRHVDNREANEEVAAIALFVHDIEGRSLRQIRDYIKSLSDYKLGQIVKGAAGRRKNRRHYPGREFENVTFEVEYNVPAGEYRDLHRHRMATQQAQVFTTKHGFLQDPLMAEAVGSDDDLRTVIRRSEELNLAMRSEGGPMVDVSQYPVLMGFKQNFYFTRNVRNATHTYELRTAPGGHPNYRRIFQAEYEAYSKANPDVAGVMVFIDTTPEATGRLLSEIRTARKLKKLEAQT